MDNTEQKQLVHELRGMEKMYSDFYIVDDKELPLHFKRFFFQMANTFSVPTNIIEYGPWA